MSYDNSHEWLGEKKGSSSYRNVLRRKTLSPDLFAYDSSPTYSASPPCRALSKPQAPLSPAILRHLPMTRAARARQGRLQLVLGCRRWLQGVCDAMPEVMSSELPHAVSCARCVTILDDDNRAARNFATISRRTNVYEVVVHKYT